MSIRSKIARSVQSAAKLTMQLLGCSLILGLVGFSFFGVYRAFDREGVGMGAWAVFFPPYSLYKGLAWFWEEPEWKSQWDNKTSQIAFLLTVQPNPDITLTIKKHAPEIRDWALKIPAGERKKLKHSCRAFGEAFHERLVEINRSLFRLEGFPIEPGPKIRELIKEASAIPALTKQWIRSNQSELAADFIVPQFISMMKETPLALEFDHHTGLPNDSDVIKIELIIRSPEYQAFLREANYRLGKFRHQVSNRHSSMLQDLLGN